MNKEIIQIENINSHDFKNEIVKEFSVLLKSFTENFQNPQNETLLSRHETANLLGISTVSLWEWTRKDIIPAYKINNKVFYKKNEVLESLKKYNKF